MFISSIVVCVNGGNNNNYRYLTNTQLITFSSQTLVALKKFTFSFNVQTITCDHNRPLNENKLENKGFVTVLEVLCIHSYTIEITDLIILSKFS